MEDEVRQKILAQASGGALHRNSFDVLLEALVHDMHINSYRHFATTKSYKKLSSSSSSLPMRSSEIAVSESVAVVGGEEGESSSGDGLCDGHRYSRNAARVDVTID
jgi:hypothetical protein